MYNKVHLPQKGVTAQTAHEEKRERTKMIFDVDVDYTFLHFMMVCRHKTDHKRTPGVI